MSNVFFVALAHSLLDNRSLLVDDMEIRWNNWVPIKLNVFIWRLSLQSIPTRERLSYGGIEVEFILCPICHNGVETIEHLFCGFSDLHDIWTCIAIWWDVPLPVRISIQTLLS